MTETILVSSCFLKCVDAEQRNSRDAIGQREFSVCKF